MTTEPEEYPTIQTSPAGGELSQVEKIGFNVLLSRGFMFPRNGPLSTLLFGVQSNPDPAYARRVESVTTVEPTPEELASYAEAKAAWETLSNSDHVYWEPDGGLSLDEPPCTRQETVYSETWEEWQNRCQELDKNK